MGKGMSDRSRVIARDPSLTSSVVRNIIKAKEYNGKRR